jgi:hypothetical protein
MQIEIADLVLAGVLVFLAGGCGAAALLLACGRVASESDRRLREVMKARRERAMGVVDIGRLNAERF